MKQNSKKQLNDSSTIEEYNINKRVSQNNFIKHNENEDKKHNYIDKRASVSSLRSNKRQISVINEN